jgi:hypothetical protein
VTKLNKEHNHEPLRAKVVSFVARVDDLTEEHESFIRKCADCHLLPSDTCNLVRQCFPEVAHLDSQTIKNIQYAYKPTSSNSDAHDLLQLLFKFQREDPRWFVEYAHDDAGRLHLGVWAYGAYLRAVGIAPNIIFTDADPGATASVATIFPAAKHIWCLWHIFINLQKNVATKLGPDRYTAFSRAFRLAQQQLTEALFEELYQALKRDFPEAVPYLDGQLTDNAQRWATAFFVDTFTAGGVSTQRGEGLNRHVKRHLDGRSSLNKVCEVVSHREVAEEARYVEHISA